MRFRVTSIQDSGLPSTWNDCQPWLEDWLNAALGSGEDFGGGNVHVMLVIFASDSLTSEPRPSRLTRTDDGDPLLCLHVVVPPVAINGTKGAEHIALLCRGVYAGLPEKLMRKPKDLNYSRLRLAIQACVRPFVQRETVS